MAGLWRSLVVCLVIFAAILAISPADAAKKKKSVCSKPMKAGPCEAAMTRYYFSDKTGECEQFAYGGCKGNKNRFKTKTKCEKRCKKAVVNAIGATKPKSEVCGYEKEVGRCRAAHKRYYYNKTEKKCMKFTYGGCGGNGNNFKTMAECKKTCIKK